MKAIFPKGVSKKLEPRIPCRLIGGPLHNARVLLRYPGTLPIRIGNQVGYYDIHNLWVDKGN